MNSNTSSSMISEFLSNPVPFVAGFVSGTLGLQVNQDPVRTWLESQGVTVPAPRPSDFSGRH